MIQNTKKAIKYYKLAIQNAENMLDFEIKKDEQYQEFCEKYQARYNSTTMFYYHTQDFGFYDYTEDDAKVFFEIKNNEIIYNKDNTFDGVKDIAEELLSIVSKLY